MYKSVIALATALGLTTQHVTNHVTEHKRKNSYRINTSKKTGSKPQRQYGKSSFKQNQRKQRAKR